MKLQKIISRVIYNLFGFAWDHLCEAPLHSVEEKLWELLKDLALYFLVSHPWGGSEHEDSLMIPLDDYRCGGGFLDPTPGTFEWKHGNSGLALEDSFLRQYK